MRATTGAEMEGVRGYLEELQDRICGALQEVDGDSFDSRLLRDEKDGETRPRVLSDGGVFERAAVIGSFSRGDRLPPAVTQRRPELSNRGFEAASLSLIVHPWNPFAPTTHANLRFFIAGDQDGEREPAWWFGGGFDLTPFYGFEEDAKHWHGVAKRACDPFGEELYSRFKKACDDYFFLPHRNEARGIGGLFFEDLSQLESRPAASERFESCFSLVRSVGDHFLDAYLPILKRRKDHPYTEKNRDFQLYRRGRYVEFNLVHDRGTRYGLQAGRPVESILASLPPRVHWQYDWSPEEGSEEQRLYQDFLVKRDWLD